ncbi:MAG: DMT family transporter [Chlamydiales bacterium]|nr:DMT family transporter [Chlamydiales bacterium]
MTIEQPNIIKGSLYAIVGFFCMALFGILTKVAIQTSSAFWVSFLAYLTGSTILLPYIIKNGFGYLKSEHYSYLIGRAVFGTIASLLYTISIHYIPIVNSTLLFNTAPIFIPLLMLLFLKVKIEKSIWIAVAIGFIGIIFIIRPTEAIFTHTGNFIALISGLSLAVAYLLMKLLTNTDPGIRIIFYYLGIGALIQVPLLFFIPSYPSLEAIFFAVLSGAALLTAQLSLVHGYKYAEASQIGIYQYVSVVFVGMFDWLIWDIVPKTLDLVGVLLVITAGVIIIHNNHSKNGIPSK